MVFTALRLSAEEVATLRADPDTAFDLLLDDEREATAAGRLVYLDKSWHAIHFLLTGTAWDAETPAGQAILGGVPIGGDSGYGPVRLLERDDVRAIAAALGALDASTLRDRYRPERLNEVDIYPGIWDEDDVFDTYLLPHFSQLAAFYATAAAEGSAVLAGLS
jgi:hypothetical protein